MKIGKDYQEFEELNGISVQEILSVFEAVTQAYPLIVSANLTKNTYTMIKDGGFLLKDLPMTGKYDDMIDSGVEDIHPNYQNVFLKNFSREGLLQLFGHGKREVSAKIYQKVKGDTYQWVSVHVIRVQDRNGDICHICMNRVLKDLNMGEMPRVSGGAPY